MPIKILVVVDNSIGHYRREIFSRYTSVTGGYICIGPHMNRKNPTQPYAIPDLPKSVRAFHVLHASYCFVKTRIKVQLWPFLCLRRDSKCHGCLHIPSFQSPNNIIKIAPWTRGQIPDMQDPDVFIKL